MGRFHYRSARRKPLKAELPCGLVLLVGLATVFFLTFSLALVGFFSPPMVPPHLLQELPWLRPAPGPSSNGTFRSRCSVVGSSNRPTERFLAAVIFNRVFGSDLFGISPFECKQWIEYMLYAGVEHIFWYDTAHNNAESQEAYLHPYSHAGLLTYLRFHHLFPGSVKEGFHFEQDNSYRHFLSTFKESAKWVIQMDVDEYPFSAMDQQSCFLQRFVREYEVSRPNVTQILLQCMTFAGNPQGDLVNGWVIERYQRRKYETEGVETGYQTRQKPIYHADLCKGIIKDNPHVVRMEEGKTVVASDDRIRMNYYWGAREVGFRPDTLEATGMLVPDSSIQPIASGIKQATGLIKREDDVTGSLMRWMARA